MKQVAGYKPPTMRQLMELADQLQVGRKTLAEYATFLGHPELTTFFDVQQVFWAKLRAKEITNVEFQKFLEAEGQKTFAELFAACHQDWWADYFAECNFPLLDDDGTGQKDVFACCLGMIHSDDVESEMKRLNLKPVGIRRAMEYIAKNPGAQMVHPLAVFGSQWKHEDNRQVAIPYFFGREGERYISVRWLNSSFNENVHFLVVRDGPIVDETKPVIDCDVDPFIPKGWAVAVEEHQSCGQLVWDTTKIKLHLSDNQKTGNDFDGHHLRQELSGLPVLNACVLDYLLDHQNLIPEEWKGEVVYFWGTIYRVLDNSLVVFGMYWNGSMWTLHRCWLKHDWSNCGPAILLVS